MGLLHKHKSQYREVTGKDNRDRGGFCFLIVYHLLRIGNVLLENRNKHDDRTSNKPITIGRASVKCKLGWLHCSQLLHLKHSMLTAE
jgi:hypothetical protein